MIANLIVALLFVALFTGIFGVLYLWEWWDYRRHQRKPP